MVVIAAAICIHKIHWLGNIEALQQVAAQPAASPAKSGSMLQTVMIVIIVLAAVALLAYQFVGCGSCYSSPSI